LNILLLESSSKKIEFAFSKSGEIAILKKLDSESNADSLIYIIKQEFESANLDISCLDAVSISNGPGSFTGLRISSAIAKGICFGLGCNLIEIPTLDIIAGKYGGEPTEKILTALVFSNSKTNEFYAADYSFNNKIITRISGYYIRKAEEFDSADRIFLINEEIEQLQPFNFEVISLSGISNIYSQLDLTNKFISENKYSDYRTSEPFYMKNFVPTGSSN
jgi:tRNA threonylcarbamoyladenosine biosynthesis protein TsaB